jgi:hypothetical protein
LSYLLDNITKKVIVSGYYDSGDEDQDGEENQKEDGGSSTEEGDTSESE